MVMDLFINDKNPDSLYLFVGFKENLCASQLIYMQIVFNFIKSLMIA